MVNRWQLRMFGSPALLDEAGLVQPITGKSLALLVWLARGPSGPAHREQLADLLWSDADEERALQSLRQSLSQLRARLGAEAIRAEGRSVELVAAVRSDAADFERAIADGDHERAATMYRGPFLDRFALPGASQFEHWADRERERLRALWMGAQDTRAQQLLDAGRAREAREIAAILRDMDVERERSWRLLMESALAMGNAPLAEGDAAALQLVLADAGREPEPATRRLLQRVARGGSAKPGEEERTSIAGELVGREVQFATLVKAWQRAEAGRTATRIVIEAPAGLGKTRLLTEFSHRLGAAGATFTLERARIGETEIPFSFAAAVVAALARLPGSLGVAPAATASLCALAPSLRATYRTAPAEQLREEDLLRTRAWAIGELLRAVTDDHAVALLLDDWQWADASSRSLLEAAFARADGVPLLMVRARRVGEVVPLDGLGAAEAVVHLPPWTADEVRVFLESIAVWPVHSELMEIAPRVHATAAGSPLMVRMVLELALETGRLSLADRSWSVREMPELATWLSQVHLLDEQTRRLGPAERQLALWLAVAGGPLSVSTIETAAHASDVTHALRALERRGWIRLHGDVAMLTHDALHGAMLSAATSEELRASRTSLGRALAHRPGTLDRVGAQRAARILLAAGDETTLRALFVEWHSRLSLGGGLRDARAAAYDLLGAGAAPVHVAALARTLPLSARVGEVGGQVMALVAVAIIAGAALSLAVMSPSRPFAVRFVEAPLNVSQASAVPTPTVEIIDARGQRVLRDGDTVRLVAEGQDAPWPGSTSVARAGVARFPEFRAPLGGDYVGRVYRASSGRLRSDSSLRVAEPSLRILKGIVNGHAIDSTNTFVRLLVGERIVVRLGMRIVAPWPAAAVMHTAVPTWGDPTTSWVELGPAPTPTRDHLLESSFELPAPPKTGRYYVFLALAAEPSSVWIASATNWTAGKPIWNDGNDLSGWSAPEAQLVRAGARGFTEHMFADYHGRPAPSRPAADVITLDVVEP
jgi:DNA-binding SARP family transcriptional activator